MRGETKWPQRCQPHCPVFIIVLSSHPCSSTLSSIFGPLSSLAKQTSAAQTEVHKHIATIPPLPLLPVLQLLYFTHVGFKTSITELCYQVFETPYARHVPSLSADLPLALSFITSRILSERLRVDNPPALVV